MGLGFVTRPLDAGVELGRGFIVEERLLLEKPMEFVVEQCL